MERYITYLIFIATIAAALLSPVPAAYADPTSCPSGYKALPDIEGIYADSEFCVPDNPLNYVSIDPGPRPGGSACGFYQVARSLSGFFGGWDTFVGTIPSLPGNTGNMTMRVDVEVSHNNFLGNPSGGPVIVRARSYGSTGALLDTKEVDTGRATPAPGTGFSSYNDATGRRWHLLVYEFDATPGGWIEFDVIYPDTGRATDFFIAGFKVQNAAIATSPPPAGWCLPYPNPFIPPEVAPTPTPAPPTGTPLPTQTPGGPTATATTTPTNTPTPSPTYPGSFPTAVGGTPTQQPTATSIYQFATVPAYQTGTPLPVISFPTVQFTSPELLTNTIGPIDFDTGNNITATNNFSMPGLSFPGITAPSLMGWGDITATLNISPDVGTSQLITDINNLNEGAAIVVTRWHTQTQTALSFLAVTNTVGVSTALEMKTELISNIEAPFSYARILQFYMPTLWPVVSFGIIAFGWIMFNIIVKYGLAIISEFLELVRKIIEIFPFIQ